MKAIVDKSLLRDESGAELEGQTSNVVVDVFPDDAFILIDENCIEVITSYKLIFADRNSSNSVIVEGITPPEDYAAHKYTYDADADPQWALNTAWVDPDAE